MDELGVLSSGRWLAVDVLGEYILDNQLEADAR